MDLFDLLLQSGLVTGILVIYLIFFRKQPYTKGHYREPGWNYPLKLLWARYAVKRWKSGLPSSEPEEMPRNSQVEGWDDITFRTVSTDGVAIVLSIRKLCRRHPIAELTVHVKLPDGTSYKLTQHPDTAVNVWQSLPDGWSAGGLKIQILEPGKRMRILFNGLLNRLDDNVTQHAKFNFIWASGSSIVRHPEDWSDELAGQALALVPWRDDNWVEMLGHWEDGSWHQWGTVQGRFLSYDAQGVMDKDIYIRTRGVRERNWAPHSYQGLRRTVTITLVARNGTMIQLRVLSYKKNLTQCVSGSVRYPNYIVTSITSTDLVLSDFCETADGIPKVYTVDVGTKDRSYKLVLRISEIGCKVFSGIPYEQVMLYRTMEANIDEQPASGILELSYLPTEISEPSVPLLPAPVLNWLSEKEASEVGYCVTFENRGSSCTNYVGGKGASLALLASMQKSEGYRVPPGYCLTTLALEKHLENNPEIRAAILEIQASNENYDEVNFKEKCRRAVELFHKLNIAGDLRQDILDHLTDLRRKAKEQLSDSEIRFAVRSSAVGEDSEALSAAGQNETILGCVTNDDVLQGVQKCWGSMFAFTSAYYRRQNGQPCLCGGGVVVQALVTPQTAGVMFTRHPDAGDPSRLLITANYGLGESVVSGSVEPDTIIIKRDKNKLSIMKVELGSKTQRVTAAGSGVTMEDVSESDRLKSCLSEEEALKLAKLGVSQEELWGAGRDIEWAICNNEIFLLQARPITSLERWTEEELLHELDFPIMSDDELITFANTGEVMPKPITPLTYDLMLEPLSRAVDVTIVTNGDGYDKSIVVTHNRSSMALFNTVYRRIPKKIDLGIRMIEMAVHGHKVADEAIYDTALQRNPPHWSDTVRMYWLVIKSLTIAKSTMKDSIKNVDKADVKDLVNDPLKLFNVIEEKKEILEKLSYNHGVTTTASTTSQFIAMSVLLEGNTDFTAEHCNEIGTLLSSGDVLSAEVPHGLMKLAGMLEKSGRSEEFKALDPKEAMDWLKTNLPQVHKEVEEFLEKHGCRAIMEFDLSTKPWALAPEEMMTVLQNTKSSREESHVVKSKEDVIDSLTSPKKGSTKKVLRWVLPLCRSMVRYRECTKGQLVLGIHKVRLALRHLSRLLVRAWYFPNEDLIFYFTQNELRAYIQTRDPALLKKALQRQQFYPKWGKLKFAEVNEGWLTPLETKIPLFSAGDTKIVATSVCGGEVVSRACVVKDLSEIHQLQHGDILITHATDIGWSPYFPLLAGIVTELGGLISHGAVIAREYGITCIVGAANATDFFKTGDMIRLSGTKGIVEKVTLSDESEQNHQS